MISDFNSNVSQLGDCPPVSGMGYVSDFMGGEIADFMGWDEDTVDLYGAVSDFYQDPEVLGVIADYSIEPELMGEIADMTDQEIQEELPELMGGRFRRALQKIRARRQARRAMRGRPPIRRRRGRRGRRALRGSSVAFAPLPFKLAALFGKRKRARKMKARKRAQAQMSPMLKRLIARAQAGQVARPITDITF